jgi:mannitol-1-/sugar-/sorbitol-6-/2-deoxyglucose-6-phosphatase
VIEAVIFDMDGVLVDSEPFWRVAMIKGFREVGIDFTDEHCKTTTGMRFDEVVRYWHQRSPWEHKTVREVEQGVLDHLCELINEKGKPMPGALEAISHFKKEGRKIGLATSSYHRLVNVILEKLEARHHFHAVESAEHLEYGKPHPQVFLNCAAALGVKPERCLVIEDSVNGVVSAKAARMKVIAIPDPADFHNPKFALADLKLASLNEIDLTTIQKAIF